MRLASLLFFICISVLGAAAEQGRALKVMPIGDSITEGKPNSSYRAPLWRLLRMAGWEVDFVGSHWLGDANSGDFDPDFEGKAGLTTYDILNGIPAWLSQSRPDVVLLHIGTNDIYKCWGVDYAISNLGQIIQRITEHSPSTTILVAKIIPIGDKWALRKGWMLFPWLDDRYCGSGKSMNELVAELNRRIDSLETKTSKVKVVDMYSAINPDSDLQDGLHPNQQGYEKMAARWFQELQPLSAQARFSE